MKFIGLKKAVGEYNHWSEAARVYYDRATGEIMVFVYPSLCSFQQFDNASVIEVMSKSNLIAHKTSMRELKERIEEYVGREEHFEKLVSGQA